MHHVGRDLDGALKYEFSKRHARMGDDQVISFNHLIAKQQNIQIDRPRRPSVRPYTPKFRFDFASKFKAFNLPKMALVLTG